MVVLSVIVLEVVRPPTVAVVVVPMIRLPPPVVALPSEIAAVLLFSDRKSVAMIAPPVTETAPATVVPTPSIVRLPAPDLVRSLPASVPPMTLPCINVLPAPPIARTRGLLAVLPSERDRLPVNVRFPPASFASVFVRELAEVFASVA